MRMPRRCPGCSRRKRWRSRASAFLSEPVKVKPAAVWLELAASPLPWLAAVDGYNLSYLKPDATAAAYSGDEYAAPLVAFWQRGLGRAAAGILPARGRVLAECPGLAGGTVDFLQTLARWLMGSELPAGIALRPRVDGSELHLDLLYDASWDERMALAPPQALVADGASGQARPVVWERMDPGHFRAVTPAQAGSVDARRGAGRSTLDPFRTRRGGNRSRMDLRSPARRGIGEHRPDERRRRADQPRKDLGRAAPSGILGRSCVAPERAADRLHRRGAQRTAGLALASDGADVRSIRVDVRSQTARPARACRSKRLLRSRPRRRLGPRNPMDVPLASARQKPAVSATPLRTTFKKSSMNRWIIPCAVEALLILLMSLYGDFLKAGEAWRFTLLGIAAGGAYWAAARCYTRAESGSRENPLGFLDGRRGAAPGDPAGTGRRRHLALSLGGGCSNSTG